MIIDLRQTQEYCQYMEALGWEVVRSIEHSGAVDFLYLRKIPFLGYIGKLQRPSSIKPHQVRTICSKWKVKVLYVEPRLADSAWYVGSGFVESKSSFVPAKTIQIDLTKSEKQLLAEMKPKTRYNIGLAQRRGVVAKSSQEVDRFIEIYTKSARKRGMWISQEKEIRALWETFVDNADLLLAIGSNQLLGGVLVIYAPEVSYYMYAGSTEEGKKLFAPTLLAWEAIRLAKKKKKKVFDFEGIYDARYPQTKAWRGFTKFKEGFGGKIVEYPKTLVYYRNPILRLLGV